MLAYELWETESGNLMASYDSEGEALRAISDRAHRHGPSSVLSIALVQVDEANDQDEMTTLAEGAALLARAERATVQARTA